MSLKNRLNDFKLIAHRGASDDAPENTLEAFDLALENGFDNVETDVQLSSDGRAVLIHDDTLDRTTDGSGVVAETTFADIKTLSAGDWFQGPDDSVGLKEPSAYANARIPTLDEFCERYAGKLHLHLELKSSQPRLAEVSRRSLERWGWLAQHSGDLIAPGLTISSFNFVQLERSVQLMPQIAHGWLLRAITEEAVAAAVRLGLSGIYPHASDVTTSQVQLANNAGLFVRTWGIGCSRQALDQAYRAGARGTTIDWPSQARDYLGNNSRRLA